MIATLELVIKISDEPKEIDLVRKMVLDLMNDLNKLHINQYSILTQKDTQYYETNNKLK